MAAAMAALFEIILDLDRPFGKRDKGDLWVLDSDDYFGELEERLGLLEISYQDFSGQRRITEEIHASVEDSFKVKFCDMPADFRWSERPSISDQTVVQQIYDMPGPALRKEEGTTVPSDKEAFSFVVLKEGETWITIEGSQSGDNGVENEWLFSMKVVVK
jgi:hypothetical protein